MANESRKPATRPGKTEFSIDEFIGEIEKAEAETANKRLPQERLRNKRALDNAARRAAEEQAAALVPAKATKTRRTAASTRSEATGMQLKAPKSKANSVDRPTNLEGFSESPQAGF